MSGSVLNLRQECFVGNVEERILDFFVFRTVFE